VNGGGQKAQMFGRAANAAVATQHLVGLSPSLKVPWQQTEKIVERTN